jgi:hypothetical protein
MKFFTLISSVALVLAAAEGNGRILKGGNKNTRPVAVPVAVPNPGPSPGVPVAVPVPVPTPVAFPVAVPVPVAPAVPQNCCQFLAALAALDAACYTAAQQGLVALSLRNFQLTEDSCVVTGSDVTALQNNFRAARTAYRAFIATVQAKGTPVTQKCFNAPYLPTFACEQTTETDFKTTSIAGDNGKKNFNSLKDLVCCGSTAGTSGAVTPQLIYDPALIYPKIVSGAADTVLSVNFCSTASANSPASTGAAYDYSTAGEYKGC